MNNNDVKVNKRPKVKAADNKESSNSGTSVSCQQRDQEDNEQHVSVSKNKVADNTGKQSKGKKVKDDASDLNGSSTRKLKSDSAHQQVLLFLGQLFRVDLIKWVSNVRLSVHT